MWGRLGKFWFWTAGVDVSGGEVAACCSVKVGRDGRRGDSQRRGNFGKGISRHLGIGWRRHRSNRKIFNFSIGHPSVVVPQLL